MGVLIDVAVVSTAKNSSPSLALAPDSAPPVTVAMDEDDTLTADWTMGLAVLSPDSCTTSMVVLMLFEALKLTLTVPFEVPVPVA